MSDLKTNLERIGLSQYYERFVAEAFDTWEVIQDISEEDLAALDVKLGHRRVLQRAIAEHRRTHARPQKSLEKHASLGLSKTPEDDGEFEDDAKRSTRGGASSVSTSGKRKYRRHPKPDETAPARPPSAYVLFSNQVRHELRDQDFSFTELAKIVGERWQALPSDEKDKFESRGQASKEKYYTELNAYKKTAEYTEYQEYLTDFKAKHDPAGTEVKRTRKHDGKPASSVRSNSTNYLDSDEESPLDSQWTDRTQSDRRQSDANSPAAHIKAQLNWQHRDIGPVSEESGTSIHTRSPEVDSPALSPSARTLPPILPVSAGPASPAAGFRPTDVSFPGRANLPASYASIYNNPPPTSPGPALAPIDTAARGSWKVGETVPSRTPSDTSVSTSSHASVSTPSNVAAPPDLGRALPSRQLPPPIASRPLHLQHGVQLMPPSISPTSRTDMTPESGLAALLRAGEQIAHEPWPNPTERAQSGGTQSISSGSTPPDQPALPRRSTGGSSRGSTRGSGRGSTR